MLKGGSIGTLNLLFIEHCSTGKGFIWSFSPLHCFTWLYIDLHWSYCTWKCLSQSCFNPVCTFELWIEMKSLQSWEAVEVKYCTCNCHRFLPIALLFANFFFFLNYCLFFLPISPDIFFLCQICFFLNYCLFFSWFLTITFFFTKFVVFLNYCLLLPITFFRLLKLLLIFSRFLPMAFSLTNLSSS